MEGVRKGVGERQRIGTLIDLHAVTHAVAVAVRIARISAIDVDLFTIGQAIAVRVDTRGAGGVNIDFIPVGKTIPIGIKAVGIGAYFGARFLTVAQSIAVAIVGGDTGPVRSPWRLARRWWRTAKERRLRQRHACRVGVKRARCVLGRAAAGFAPDNRWRKSDAKTRATTMIASHR